MTDLDLWIIGWAVGGAAILVAALLLLTTIVAAYGIQRETDRALDALRRIDANTKAIWALGRTAKRFNAMRDYFEGLETQTARIGAAGAGEDMGRREP